MVALVRVFSNILSVLCIRWECLLEKAPKLSLWIFELAYLLLHRIYLPNAITKQPLAARWIVHYPVDSKWGGGLVTTLTTLTRKNGLVCTHNSEHRRSKPNTVRYIIEHVCSAQKCACVHGILLYDIIMFFHVCKSVFYFRVLRTCAKQFV